MGPFGQSVQAYAAAEWPCILPVPVEAKSPPPVGFTGEAGADTSVDQLVAWFNSPYADWSVALRLPEYVIGIDVDHYDKGTVSKRGGDTLAEYVARWGELPPTWSSTARGPGLSRIMFYRVPGGRFATRLGDSIEIIQRHHRYAVVAPSFHSGVNDVYRWYGPDGQPCDPPKPIELPELPERWVEGLREGASAIGPSAAPDAAGRAFLAALRADPRVQGCGPLVSATQDAERKVRASSTGTRHDTMAEQTYRLVQLGGDGHPGAGTALAYLESLWADLTAGENRGEEFDRMLVTAARKTVTRLGPVPIADDPCTTMMGLTLPAASAGSADPGEPNAVPIEAPRTLHPFAVIGAHPFDPRGQLDQILGDAVLDRTAGLLRYAHDANVWLQRGPEAWHTRSGNLAAWAVSLVARLMPTGDANAEKGSEPHDQHLRRARFMTSGASSGIAKKMEAVVSGGGHPNAVLLADLDAEPWALWAGGYPFDLRTSAEAPTLAQIDPGTPHLRSAGVTPDRRPTPLWDRFTAAVWPDPELRAWALRVLAVSLTGYSDKVLPVLVGEKDRGKTQAIALLMSVLGSYAHAADPRLLGAEIANTHSSIVYALMGRRLSFIDEGPREGRIGQERLKQLTGGGELTANAMNQNPVTWSPTHTLVLTANDEPTLTDPAVRGRVRLLPCLGDPAEVIAARRALGFTNDRLWRAEAPGVLAAMMAEAAAYLADPDTASMAACPERYRYRADEIAAQQDPINQWIENDTEPYPPGERAGVLYEAFREWCRRNGIMTGLVPNAQRWGRELTARGYPASHDRGGKTRPMRLRGPGGSIMPTTPPSVSNFMGVPTVTDPGPIGHTPGQDQPGSGSPAASSVTDPGNGDRSVTDPVENRSHAKPEVNPLISSLVTDVTDTHTPYAHTPAHTHAHPQTQNDPGSVTRSREPTGEPEPPVTLSKAEAAKIKRAATAAAARLAAIEAAAGELIELPATVDRAGEILPVPVANVGRVLAEIIMRAGALTVDIETSGYPVGHELHELRTVQLGDERLAVVLDARDPEQVKIASIALAAAPRLHAHSATADLGPLAHAGIVDLDAWGRMHDTVIPAKLADPQSTGSDPALKLLAASVLKALAVSPQADRDRAGLFRAGKWLTDTELTTPLDRSGWAQTDRRCATMVRYAASDVLDTAALVGHLPAIPAAILDREREVQRITARVNHHGLALDGGHVARKLAEHGAAMQDAAARVNAFGIDNPGSDQQVGQALTAMGVHLPQTPTGRPSVAVGALEPLRGTQGQAGALVAAVLDYRHHETVCSTFLEPYRRLVVSGDGRARPTVYTLGTDTGRMSCVRPNLQQLPREGGVRACIVADPGYTLISADFAGVELRVAAALSGDANLAGMLARGDDPHWMIAREVFGPEATKADRYVAKRVVFGRLYGGGVPTLARQAGVSESIAQSAVDVLDSMTPGLSAWSSAIRNAVKRGQTQFTSYAGRIIWLPAEYPHKGPNYCIQGSARELLVDALLKWDQTEWRGSVVLPVHDEIVAMVPEADGARATAALVACMTSTLMGVDIRAEASEPSAAWRDSV